MYASANGMHLIGKEEGMKRIITIVKLIMYAHCCQEVTFPFLT